MRRQTLTYYRGQQPLTDKDVRAKKRKSQTQVMAANQGIDICLNCTKPAKKCKGDCECFRYGTK